MTTELQFEPFVNWPLFCVLAAIAIGLAAFGLYIRRRGALLRALALGLLTLALANPSLRLQERERLRDIAIVVVDESDSQQIGARKVQTETALSDVLRQLQNLEIEQRVARVGTGTTAETDGTRLFSALEKAKSDIPQERYAGAIFLTDGEVHDVPQRLLHDGPLHGLISGSKSEIDRRIIIEHVPRFAITDREQELKFRIDDGTDDHSQVEIVVTYSNGEIGKLNAAMNTTQTLKFTLDHAGKNFIELLATVAPDELSPANNRAIVTIEGIRDRLRVLLVSGEPHPGERTWRNMLKADAGVDLVHFTILRPPEKQDGTPTKELSLIAFPTRELFIDKLSEFDLVIFDRYRRQTILPEEYLANVANYVRKGGAVLLASGPDFAAGDGLYSSALSDILVAAPTGEVTERAFRPMITETGRRHPVTKNLRGGTTPIPTWGQWFRIVDSVVPNNVKPLFVGPDEKPLLVMERVGEGRVVQFLSDHGWLWARGYDGGGPQVELLRRICHWLMKEPDLEEEALTAKQDGRKLRVERRTLSASAADVIVRTPSGKDLVVSLSQVEEGLFAGTVEPEERGMYRVSDTAHSTAAAFGDADAKEMRDLKATTELLQPIVSQTRGAMQWMEAGKPRLSYVRNAAGPFGGTGWMGMRDNQQYRTISVRDLPVFSTLLSLAVLLLLVPAVWYREGR